MAAETIQLRRLFFVVLLSILLPLPQALAQKEAEADEISEIRLNFERIRNESLLDGGVGDLGLEGMQFSD